MANQPKAGTSVRRYRCEDELWESAQATSQRVGTDLSKVARDALVAFVASNALEEPQVWGHGLRGPASLMPATIWEWPSWSPFPRRWARGALLGSCPGCEDWQLDFNPDELVAHGRLLAVEDAAWEHLEQCAGLVVLARQASII